MHIELQHTYFITFRVSFFEPIFSTDRLRSRAITPIFLFGTIHVWSPYSEHNLYVECDFHHLDGIMFQGDIHNRYALYRAQNTISFSWSKSCLETIYNTVELHVVRKYMNFISCRKTCFQTRFCTNWM